MYLKKISTIGIHDGIDESLKSQILWLNKMAIIAVFLAIIYMLLHSSLESSHIAIFIDSFYIITSILIFHFHKKLQYQYANLTFGIGYTIALACTGLLVGAQTQIEYLIFVPTFGALLLFRQTNFNYKLFFFGFTIFLLLKIYFFYYPKGMLGVTYSPFFSVMNGLVVFWIIYTIFNRAITDSKESYKALKLKHEEVTELNKTLELKVNKRTQEIQKKSKELAQSHKELRSFSYIAAHDMREPLRNIISFTQLLNRDILDRNFGKVEEYSGYIDWAARRIDTITKDIVNYTNLEVLRTNQSENNLNDIIYEIMREYNAKRHDIILQVDALPTIFINRELITILFGQLIDNAIQFCDKPEPEITITYKSEKNYHQFSVKDNGIGIPEEFYTKIFLMFKRLDNDYQKQGSGIGLSICRKIVAIHGGKIWVESRVGEGSTFYFTLKK